MWLWLDGDPFSSDRGFRLFLHALPMGVCAHVSHKLQYSKTGRKNQFSNGRSGDGFIALCGRRSSDGADLVAHTNCRAAPAISRGFFVDVPSLAFVSLTARTTLWSGHRDCGARSEGKSVDQHFTICFCGNGWITSATAARVDPIRCWLWIFDTKTVSGIRVSIFAELAV